MRTLGTSWHSLSRRDKIAKNTPAVGFEPTTNRLTADRSTTELRWIALVNAEHTLASPFALGKRRFRYKRRAACAASFRKSWLRGLDLNQRPSGYEPDELPGCSTPRFINTLDLDFAQSKNRAASSES